MRSRSVNNIGGIHQRINKKATLEAWARYTVQDWRKEISRRRIGSTGKLASSFKYVLFFDKNSDIAKIKFEFAYYGRFVDMGVGKGTNINQVAENKISRRLEGKNYGNRRRAKKWQGKPFHYNIGRLREIMADKFAMQATHLVIKEITSGLTLPK